MWVSLWNKRLAIQGPNHLDTISVKGWLGRVAQEQGRYEEVITIRQEEVTLRMSVLGSHNITVLDAQEWLVRAYFHLQRYEEAEGLARQVLAGKVTVIGDLNPSTINSRVWIATILCCKGRLADSASLYERILKQRMDLWGAHHALVALTKSRLAQVYEGMGRCEDARALAEEALSVQRESLKPDHPALKETLDLLNKLDNPPVSDGPAPSSDVPPNVQGSTTRPAQQLPTRESEDTYALSLDIDDQSPQEHIPQSTAAAHELARSFSPFQQRDKFGRHPNPWSMFM
jgi:tetratricopeptide (TPR) repeat protein